jgi:putative hydrolase of the HAD superfamily
LKPILLFDLGDTLIRYYQREEFPPILQEGIQRAKEAVEQAGCVVPSEAEIQCRVAAENHEAKNSRVRPLEKRLAYIFGVKHRTSDRAWWLPICRAFLVPIFAIAEIYEDTLPALDTYRKLGYRIGILSNCPWGAPGLMKIGGLRTFFLPVNLRVFVPFWVLGKDRSVLLACFLHAILGYPLIPLIKTVHSHGRRSALYQPTP